ncbi:MAG: mandelate racemase/muconate lactonizing protein [Chloroflexota bacterium]|nr:mandelate racemase/muconate lactonizing protein [Chloroflexota bacterium]
MKITAVKLRQLTGTLEHEGDFWEERLIRPIDIYPEHKATRSRGGLPTKVGEGRYQIRAVYLQIDTDEGISGIGGPIGHEVAYIVAREFRPLLEGEDALATERLWDKMYRYAVHGRKGQPMMAISVIDCALWDLKGRWAGAPVYRLLGGPVRERIPAYASALGYSLEPGRVRERAREIVAQGYGATKWFFRDGPTDGRAGIARNVELVRTLREAVGPDVDIMLDAWMSWDVPYTIQMSERLAEFAPRWIEEPVLPDKIASYAAIRERSRVPIAGGEHEYTRWGLKALMDAGACDVLQPDIYWAGGISELLKICALASTYDLPVVPHGHSVPATAHLIASQPITLCPILEYLVKWNEIHQFFWKEPLKPVDGFVTPPSGPGMGMELDPAKIEYEEEVRWA